MLESIREGVKGPWAAIIVVLIVVSFVFTGVSGYMGSSANAEVAIVNGQPISRQVFDQAYQNQRQQLQSDYPELAEQQLSDPQFVDNLRRQVLDRLINDQLLEMKAEKLGLRVSDKQVRDEVLSLPSFQIAGEFNNDRYRQLIRQAGFQPDSFREYLRAEMTRQQLAEAIAGSAVEVSRRVQQQLQLSEQQRRFRILEIDTALFKDQVEVTEDSISAFYESSIERFDAPEEVAVDYVSLSVADLLDSQSVDSNEIAEFYNDNADNYRTEEERRASHILLEATTDGVTEDMRDEAEALLSRVRSGENFAQLAGQFSDDTFSAEQGGDLGVFARGMMAEQLEDAVFSANELGIVNDIIETEFGLHIVRVDEIIPSKRNPLAEVESDIEQLIREEKAMGEFLERQRRMADVAFEVADSLNEVAFEGGVEVQSLGLSPKGQLPEPLSDPLAAQAIFSDEVLVERLNSDIIELSDEQVMFVRVTDYQPQRTLPLKEVRQDIVNELGRQQALRAARQWATGVLALSADREAVKKTLDEFELAWSEEQMTTKFASSEHPNVTDKIFTLAMPDQPSAVTDNGLDKVFVVDLLEVQDAEAPDPSFVAQLSSTFRQQSENLLLESFVMGLRESAEIEYKL